MGPWKGFLKGRRIMDCDDALDSLSADREVDKACDDP